MTNDELTEVIARRIARDRYRYNMSGQPLSDKDRDKYAESDWRAFVDQATSALAVVKPEIERALAKQMHEWWSEDGDADFMWFMLRQRGIDLEEKT